jgi:hypothetical protein
MSRVILYRFIVPGNHCFSHVFLSYAGSVQHFSMRHMEMKDVTERAELYQALDARSETQTKNTAFFDETGFLTV